MPQVGLSHNTRRDRRAKPRGDECWLLSQGNRILASNSGGTVWRFSQAVLCHPYRRQFRKIVTSSRSLAQSPSMSAQASYAGLVSAFTMS